MFGERRLEVRSGAEIRTSTGGLEVQLDLIERWFRCVQMVGMDRNRSETLLAEDPVGATPPHLISLDKFATTAQRWQANRYSSCYTLWHAAKP